MRRRAVAVVIAAVYAASAASADETSGSQPLHFGPISYFEQNCANCHGSLGSNYGDTFGVGRTDAQLFKSVEEMCEGPGNAPLKGEELEAEVAFHRALARKQPFVSWTSAENSNLSGEATPGSQLSVTVGDKQSSATLDQEKWTIALPPGVSADKLSIEASKAGKTSQLKLAESNCTHRKK